MSEREALLDDLKYRVSFACAEYLTDREITPIDVYEATHAIENALQEIQSEGLLGEGEVIPLLEFGGAKVNITFAAAPGTPVWDDLTEVGFTLIDINE